MIHECVYGIYTDSNITETLSHEGAINGWNALVAFIPTKQIDVAL